MEDKCVGLCLSLYTSIFLYIFLGDQRDTPALSLRCIPTVSPSPPCRTISRAFSTLPVCGQSLVAAVTAGRGEEEAHEVTARVERREEERERAERAEAARKLHVRHQSAEAARVREEEAKDMRAREMERQASEARAEVVAAETSARNRAHALIFQPRWGEVGEESRGEGGRDLRQDGPDVRREPGHGCEKGAEEAAESCCAHSRPVAATVAATEDTDAGGGAAQSRSARSCSSSRPVAATEDTGAGGVDASRAWPLSSRPGSGMLTLPAITHQKSPAPPWKEDASRAWPLSISIRRSTGIRRVPSALSSLDHPYQVP